MRSALLANMTASSRVRCGWVVLPLLLSAALASPAAGQAVVEVEMIPEHPGPYVPGESVAVDVWLHNLSKSYMPIGFVRLDFSLSSQGFWLPAFAFDYSSVPDPMPGWEEDSVPPVVSALFLPDCPCPGAYIQLPSGGSVRLGGFVVQLPTDPGQYVLDALNVKATDDFNGAKIIPYAAFALRATEGEIVGSPLTFEVPPPPIPAASTWGMLALTGMVLISAELIRRRAKTPPQTCAIPQHRPAPSATLTKIDIP